MIGGFDGVGEGMSGAIPDVVHDAADPGLDPDHHMYLPTGAGGEMTDLGSSLWDTDHDGIGDTASLHTSEGLSVVADVDEDGVADRVTTFGPDGTYETWSRAPGGAHWQLVEHGKVGK